MAGNILGVTVSEDLSSSRESSSPDTSLAVVEVPQYVDPRVDILVLAYRRPSLPEAIAALVQQTHRVEYRVSIMLNGATDDVAKAVRETVRGVHIEESPINLGFSAGMNRLAEKAQGDYIVMLNDDTEVQDGWLDQLVEAADDMPDAGIVTSRLVFPDGRLQEAGARLSYSGTGVQVGWGEPDDDPDRWVRREVDYGSAAALLIRREAFERVGGFDESFFPAYYEDVDLALRVRAAGWKVVYEPMAIATHHQWGSTTAGERTYSMTYNRQTFLTRWGHLFGDTSLPTNDVPAGPLTVPAGSSTCVPRRQGHSPWEYYAQWLVEQLVDSEARQVDAEDRVNQFRAELARVNEINVALVQEALDRASRAEERAARAQERAIAETARADHHQAERAAIERLAMWKIRRVGSRLVRSSASLATRLDRRRHYLRR